jgi:hypothetical protein
MFAILLASSIYWHLPIMLVLVSLVYSATRYDEWDLIFHHAVRGAIYIIVFMGTVFVVLWSLSSLAPLVMAG